MKISSKKNSFIIQCKNNTYVHNANRFTILACAAILFFSSCQGKNNKSQYEQVKNTAIYADTVIKGSFHPMSGIVFDSSEIKYFLSIYPEFKKFEKDYLLFYSTRKFNYAWFDTGGMIDQAQLLWHHITDTSILRKTLVVPYYEKMVSVFHPDISSHSQEIVKANPEMELLLTGEYFNYADVMWGGLTKSETDKLGWFIPRKQLTFSELLDQTMQGVSVEQVETKVLINQIPKLRNAVKKYQVLQKNDTLPNIPAIAKSGIIKPGASGDVLPLIKRKMAFFELIKDTSGGLVYEYRLIEAVNQFKKTHGLKPDSVINAQLIDELNVPVKKRLEQLLVNIERFRWIPASFTSDEFIFVNIPEYTLHYFESKTEVWSCNVVVGKTMHKTVIFSGNMQYVVLSPYWNVPPSIINAEIKPGMKRNTNYLASHNMEWNGGQVRQKPGRSNSLGQVKFLFPNSNNIYLHDTPSKGLFNEEDRAFSHGCVRVGKPRDLAIRVLKQDASWTPEKIDQAMNSGIERTVTLKKTIPVYIGYFTAFMDKDNNLNFRKDVYSRDSRLYNMIVKP